MNWPSAQWANKVKIGKHQKAEIKTWASKVFSKSQSVSFVKKFPNTKSIMGLCLVLNNAKALAFYYTHIICFILVQPREEEKTEACLVLFGGGIPLLFKYAHI